MNSYERVWNRMAGLPVDRVPNLNIFMLLPAMHLGIPYGQYVSDYRKLVDGVLYCREQFETDCLCAISDPMREAQGLGAQVVIPADGVPYSPVPLIQDWDDLKKLRVVDSGSCPRMEDRLRAVEALHREAAGEIPVIGWVEGALAESCDLMGISNLMMELLDEDAPVRELLDLCQAQAISFALEQIRCGADIIGVGNAAASLIGPDLYEELVLPYDIQLFEAIHQAGAKVKLHICGNINEKLPLIARSGADIVDCDHMVSMELAARTLPETCCINGNLNPVAFLPDSQEDIAALARRCAASSPRSMVSAGCEIPRDAAPARIRQMLRWDCI